MVVERRGSVGCKRAIIPTGLFDVAVRLTLRLARACAAAEDAEVHEDGDDEDDEAELWRGKVNAFRSLYAFLSQAIPYQDSDLEKLYMFLRHLSAKLPRRKTGPTYDFDDDVRLDYYRLQKIREGSISLTDSEAKPLDGPAEVGSGIAREEQAPLSRLIDVVHDRFGTVSTKWISCSLTRSLRLLSGTKRCSELQQ